MSAKLISDLLVELGAGQTVALSHGIEYGGMPRIPDRIMPEWATGIGVDYVDATIVRFTNYSQRFERAKFLVEKIHSIQKPPYDGGGDDPLTLYWQGAKLIPQPT